MSQRSHREILRAVRRIEIATRRAVNAELAGRYHSVFKGQGMAFSEVRPYCPGDDVRRIDWNVSARQPEQGLFVKQFIEERELTVMLLVDMSASGDFGTRMRTKRELLAHVAALIAFSAIQNNDRVGLLLFTDDVELFLPPRKGTAHVLRVIREIFETKAERQGTNISAALAYLSRVQKRKSVCFLLSDFIDDGWKKAMQLARLRHDIIAAHVHDPAELSLPNIGLARFRDPETGEERILDTSSSAVRGAYERVQELRRREIRSSLRKIGCEGFELTTGGDYVAPVVGFFRNRATRLGASR